MTVTEQKTRERLDNIRSVEPILNALRTIAMGNWKAALTRRARAMDFARRTNAVLAHIPRRAIAAPPEPEEAGRKLVTALVLGSERGLCGAFNRVLAEQAARYLERAGQRGETVHLQVSGMAAAKILKRIGIQAERLPPAGSATALPTAGTADALAEGWLAAYEAGETDRVDVIYNAYLGSGRYKPSVLRLIPPRIPRPHEEQALKTEYPPIVQTDPAGLLARIAIQQLSAQLYACLLESAAAENSARFQLMEDARQNIDRLMEELEAEAAQARRQSITVELQNLAVGSGLLEEG
jgi:ATP synthase F1 gamma subunit